MNPGSDAWIGVLGGGQLGRMLALEARRMGVRVMKWTGGDDSGASSLGDVVIHDPFDSEAGFDRFVSGVNAATVEFENIPSSLLERLETALVLRPGAAAVAICQHRAREKAFLSQNGIPCAPFHIVESAAELGRALADLRADAILKTAEFGYDGKGQVRVAADASPDDLDKAWQSLGGGRAVLEKRIDLAAELSVVVARSESGETALFDPAENLHRNHILDLSIIPARLPDAVLAEARQIATGVADAMGYIGVLAIEFFLDSGGRLMVNEMAPRPHNSGHHTLDACVTSQFEQQLRAVCGFPLGSPRLLQPAVMWNLLGDLWLDPHTPPDWTQILATPGATLHLYGKCSARAGRKMGHVTFVAPTIEEALQHADRCRAHYGWAKHA
ncbi:MAG: 5-(carboxyamino)imidazole ribonucleotide synthase [Verrucomicrobiales bacterium]